MDRRPKNDTLPDGFEMIESGEAARIAISKRAMKDFDSFETRQKARLRQVLKRWCNGKALTEEMMNPNEGRTSKNKEMIQAFKAFKARLYGLDTTLDEKRTFLIVDADGAKKQNKAGPILDRAKKRADSVIDEIKGKGTK